MPIFDKFFPSDTLCRCGRQFCYVHCPGCGSPNVVAQAKDKDGLLPAPDKKWIRNWSCRRCRLKFNDVDRAQNCEAPSLNLLSTKAQRVLDTIEPIMAESLDNKTPEERQAIMEKLFSGKKATSLRRPK